MNTAQMLGLESKQGEVVPKAAKAEAKPEKLTWGQLKAAPVACAKVRQVPREVRAAIISALPVASDDGDRRVLASVLWGRTSEDTHLIVATDTYRLYHEEVEITRDLHDTYAAPEVGTYWLVCAAALREALGTKTHRRIMKSANGGNSRESKLFIGKPREGVTVTIDGYRDRYTGKQVPAREVPADYVVASSADRGKDRQVAARNIDGVYPNWPQIMPDTDFAWSGEVPQVERFAEALGKLTSAVDDASRVQFTVNGSVELSARDEVVAAQASLDCGPTDGEAHCALNGQYLVQFVEAIANRHGGDAWVTGCIGEPLEPTLWRDPRSGAQYVLMPMQEVA